MVGTGTGSGGRLGPGSGGGVTGNGRLLMIVPIWSCSDEPVGDGDGFVGGDEDVWFGPGVPVVVGVGVGSVDGWLPPPCGAEGWQAHGVAPRSSPPFGVVVTGPFVEV